MILKCDHVPQVGPRLCGRDLDDCCEDVANRRRWRLEGAQAAASALDVPSGPPREAKAHRESRGVDVESSGDTEWVR
jgi:hypothetical protein